MSRKPDDKARVPDSIAADLDHVRNHLKIIEDDYREAYLYGFDRRDSRHRHVDAENRGQERVLASGVSDPTGTVATEQMSVRAETERISKRLTDWMKDFDSIKGRLADIFKDRGEWERLGDATFQTDEEKAEEAQGKAAQEKRKLLAEKDGLEKRLADVNRRLR